uniref:Sec1 family domain-containing protein 2 n=1 Tax=Angiostrongylus cantonensis TaxID=6313 RepID=A0A0K0CZF5_ANGCA
MDPVEAGDWLSGRPQQLVFLTGLDPTNKESHSALVSTLGCPVLVDIPNGYGMLRLKTKKFVVSCLPLATVASNVRSPDRPPLNLRLVSGDLGIPQKTEKRTGRGILRRDWPLKYLEKVPALIVLFLDLDWDHSSWSEKKTEAESKCASLRASAGNTIPTSGDDPLATERAHELCQICHLTPRQLFVVPVLGDLTGYVSKLESALHELAQGFYQQRLKVSFLSDVGLGLVSLKCSVIITSTIMVKAIRARSIPNNTPALVVRQLFKLAFLSELRQDTHTAYRLVIYLERYVYISENCESCNKISCFFN